MLILTRKLSTAIIINDDIRIVVLSTTKDTVRLKIETPEGVEILEVPNEDIETEEVSAEEIQKLKDERKFIEDQIAQDKPAKRMPGKLTLKTSKIRRKKGANVPMSCR